VEAYKEWAVDVQFPKAQLINLRLFFQNILDKKKIEIKLDQLMEQQSTKTQEIEAPEIEPLELEGSGGEEPAGAAQGVQEEELLDISSIGIPMENGLQKGNVVEFDVSFQSGNEISLLIPEREKGTIEHLIVGTELNNIEFYSPFAMFQGNGVVSSNTKISTGPKRGDYSLDIVVKST